ncbi:MAG: histidine phosphatase family protein [Dactylosporangium sp.]|nr:histidine phosphatase family protein [Dactylosporangium sp.]NNJ61584.1 histidine phosphatase family protein [Dactylosporangium sp.]
MGSHTLVLLRHAKAEPPTGGLPDAQRPLADRGRADAIAAGSWLVANDLSPDLAFVSPALRARQTWDGVRQGMREAAPEATVVDTAVTLVPALYSEGVDALIAMIGSMPEEITTVLVIGHNPTISVVSAVLDPTGAYGTGLKTAGLAVHDVATTWSRCGRGAMPVATLHTARSITRSCRSSPERPSAEA